MSIKEKMKNKVFMLGLVASEDRHDLSNFLYDVERAKEVGLIDEDDFTLFRNGLIVDSIVSLKNSKRVIGRDLQPGELLDKVNYLSLIPDFESLNVSFTNDTIIDGLCVDDKDFSWWFTCGTLDSLPVEVRNNIARKLLDRGKTEKALYVLDSISRTLKFERDNYKTRVFSK